MMTAEAPQPSPALPEAVCLLGIGGMGMAPLAIYLAQAGCQVTGWDDNLLPHVRVLLERYGIEILDTDASMPTSPSLLVRSSAVREDHPMIQRIGQGVRCLRRGEFLAEISTGKNLVAIVGSHGKTTTTGMLIDMLGDVGFDFSYVLGGLFSKNAQPPAHFSAHSPWLVAEVDESDGTIEAFSPALTLVVNFDWDHPDRYASEEDLRAAFTRLIERTSEAIILPEHLRWELPACAQVETFSAPGLNFNLDNASAAMTACRYLSGSLPENPLANFAGIHRRQDVLYREGRCSVMADYAHHPTEIRALLKVLRDEREGPLWVVFQPHRYTRTQRFASDFAEVLAQADRAWVLPVYAASESPIDAGSSEHILGYGGEELQGVEPALLNGVLSEAMDAKLPATVVFIGAGDIDHMAARFVVDRQRLLSWREQVSAETILSIGKPLSRFTTLRVGGPARFYAEPASEADLIKLIALAREMDLDVLPIGRGSNLIVSDGGVDGLVVTFRHASWKTLSLDGQGRIVATAGVRLKELCSFSARECLGGFEFLEGIPGTVGGSLRMNAGAMGGWIFDVVSEVTFLTLEGELITLPRHQFHIAYRECRELVDAVALRAVFAPGTAEQSEHIRGKMDTYASSRKESQPREPSAGCMFKNPEGNHAGRLIDELGLKGLSVGGAEVSNVHANFIINTGEATSEDIIGLVRKIRETVKRERGIDLQPEALLAGQKWEDVL